MNRDSDNLPSPPAWLVDWMRDADAHCQCHSILLGSTDDSDLRDIALAVADYLNEFDCESACQWRAFDPDLLMHLAIDPPSRNLVLADPNPVGTRPNLRPDLDQIVRQLASLGGVVLVRPPGLEATIDMNDTFHICISSGKPSDDQRFHMWVNPRRFSLRSLVCVIADSFLTWSCRHEGRSQRTAATMPATTDRGFGPDLPL